MKTSERTDLLSAIGNVGPETFGATALKVFQYQSAHNPLYRRYLELLGQRAPLQSGEAPLPPLHPLPPTLSLPIRFFKTHAVKTGKWAPQTAFTSSSTTGQTPSRHWVRDLEWYLGNARRGFRAVYGDPADWRILALLPAYLERGGSSLVAMAADLIQQGNFPESGFYLNDLERLAQTLQTCRQNGHKTLLLGVSFALLELAEKYPMDLRGIAVMETGGMKGRRRELTRPELHDVLKNAFQVPEVHSEYGMTELFSQAYATGGTLFAPAPTLRAWATEINDPFCPVAPGKTGVLNLIDLANVDTCSFIATEDVGRVYEDGRFEVLGRLDASEWRGCNLMVE